MTIPLWRTSAILAIALTVAGCSREKPQGGSPPGSGASTSLTSGVGSAHVTYRPNVHVSELNDGLKSILAVNSDGTGMLLDSSNPAMRELKAGDVLVVKGFLAKRIIAAEVQGPWVAVLIQPAELTDAIQEGTIRVAAPIRFGAIRASAPRLLDALFPTAYAQSAEQDRMNKAEDKGTMDALGNVKNGIKGAILEGWTTDFDITPSEGKLNIKLRLTKNVGGFIATINGDGYLSNFDFDSAIGIEQSTYQKIDSGMKNLNGTMNFKWEVAKDTPGVQTGDDRIKLPGAIEIPLYKYLEGLPLFLEISSAIIIKPAISGGKEYSRGAFRITYDGYQHFSAKQGNIDADGNVTGDIQFLESQNIAPLAPMGMVVAFAAPRIELSFGIKKIFKFSDIKEAADKVDLIIDQLAKRTLDSDQYTKLKGSLGGSIGLGKAVSNAMKSDAAAYFEMVSSAGMSFTGASAIVPCTRHDIHLWGKVGTSADLFGQDMGKAEKEIYSKDFTRIDPPGTKLCESVGPKE